MVKTKRDLQWVHRQAGLAAQFESQDNGEMCVLESTTILGKLPDSEIWIVECDFTCTDAVADGEYWWPEERFLAVYIHEDGKPISRHATDKEVELVA